MMSALMEQPASLGEDDVRQYLNEIRQFPRLTPEQERNLAMACAAGDADAIRQMVNSNLRLVVSVAREYAGRGVPLLDLIQEGSIGLLAAAKKFDYTLEYRFSTYATKWIRQGISRCIQNYGMIRVPGHTADQIRRVTVAKNELVQQTGEEPTLEQIAARCDMTADKLKQLLALVPETCSLDAPMGEDEGGLGVRLEDIHAPQPQEQLIREELTQTMQTLLSALTERQQQVLRLRFGMDDGICRSFEQIGTQLGISKERARQFERQAMQRLQEMGADMGLEDFLNE